VEGSCFGVDCLGSYVEIKKLISSTVKSCDQYLSFVKARINAEEAHARSLAKVAAMSLDFDCGGSLCESMNQLKADTKHKSAQHLHLAENLNNDVYMPVNELRTQLSKKEKSLFAQYQSMQQEIKHLEDKYKKKYFAYERAYKDAFQSYVEYRNADSSLSSANSTNTPKRDTQTASLRTPSSSSASTPTSAFSSFASSLSPSLNTLVEKTKGKDILNWVVTSTAHGTTRRADKNELYVLATHALARAERARRMARKCWLEYVIISQRYCVKAQILYTKLQGMQESFVLIMQDHMRKMIVFESSSLANQQYDIQMLFKVMESIDTKMDILQWINKSKAELPSGNSFRENPWCSQIFVNGNLSHIADLPRPPGDTELMWDEMSHQPPQLSVELTQEISRLRLLRRRSPPPDSGESGVIDVHSEVTGSESDAGECAPTDEGRENKDLDCAYETAEDALEILLTVQSQMRVYWTELMTRFSYDSNGNSSSVPDGHRRGTSLDVGDEGLNPTGDDNSENSDESCTPSSDDRSSPVKDSGSEDNSSADSPLISSLNDNNDSAESYKKIMQTYGLLDAVAGDTDSESCDMNKSMGFSLAPPSPYQIPTPDSPDLLSLNISPSHY